MRTSKPISTISYNSEKYLDLKLHELIKAHTISDYMYIKHTAESDETKDHIHLYIQPNKLIDTMDLQEYFTEINPNDISKPFKCIDFHSSKPDDWILYCQHLAQYLASKGLTREYHYKKEDFRYYDEDTFEREYQHAIKGSEWALRMQKIQVLDILKPYEAVECGLIPMQQYISTKAYYEDREAEFREAELNNKDK